MTILTWAILTLGLSGRPNAVPELTTSSLQPPMAFVVLDSGLDDFAKEYGLPDRDEREERDEEDEGDVKLPRILADHELLMLSLGFGAGTNAANIRLLSHAPIARSPYLRC